MFELDIAADWGRFIDKLYCELRSSYISIQDYEYNDVA